MKISEPSHLNNNMWYATLEAIDFPQWSLIERHADTCGVTRPVAYAGANGSVHLAAAVNALPPARLERYLMVPRVTRIDKRQSYTPGQMREYAFGEHFGFAPYDWESFKRDLLSGAAGSLNHLYHAEDETYLAAYMFLRVREAKDHGVRLGYLLHEVRAEVPNFILSHRQLADWQQFFGDAAVDESRGWTPLFLENQKPPALSVKAQGRLLTHFTDAERAEAQTLGLYQHMVKLEHLTAARCDLGLPGGVPHLLAEIDGMPAHWLASLLD